MKLKTKFKILAAVKRVLRIDQVATTVTHHTSEAVKVKTSFTVNRHLIGDPETIKGVKRQVLAALVVELEKAGVVEVIIRPQYNKDVAHVAGGMVILVDKSKQLTREASGDLSKHISQVDHPQSNQQPGGD